ncbi:hypothetical protein CLAFUW4_09870 [Fulvia fulva]|uniref:Uncharacterized protein n=1 Tax=Passalora fulva TaxID=5499 RepID=A0A9Q8UUL5_PASFU|nr:uncharacterized protein CLAFUR5_12369 [Fulvia fulva]KAK4615741.1 hypothetical protein CLAFUR4_09876 [Fulvia fulva]KAK4617220.1 hypothetical protein CLAFUR0_09869 [Fulvia fulva]UJO23033.1 hypothetical protein CLAFUR5_12369 [Fulvia fulva]WPV18723.1 hypothetical protein CLAFUW4_09870 [Fulvia fulva]WPV33750.1 hypothetical protein CLAFUW7_09873 [Fulvia fulva]
MTSPLARQASPPPGLGAAAGSNDGLPKWLNKVPGRNLKGARAIFEAFLQKHESGIHLGPIVPLPVRRLKRLESQLTPRQIADLPLAAKKAQVIFRSEKEARKATIADLKEKVTQESMANLYLGLPSVTDPNDICDFEDREYRRRIESAPAWNRPLLPYLPPTNSEGSWQSMNTEALRVYQDEDEHRARMKAIHMYDESDDESEDRPDSGIGRR